MSSSYTFFKLLDLNRSNSQKNTFINVNILISISLITPYLLHSIPISKPKKTPPKKKKYTYFFPHRFSTKKKKKNLPLHASLSLSLSFSSTALPPPLLGCRQKKKATSCTTGQSPTFFSVVIISQIELFYCIQRWLYYRRFGGCCGSFYMQQQSFSSFYMNEGTLLLHRLFLHLISHVTTFLLQVSTDKYYYIS